VGGGIWGEGWGGFLGGGLGRRGLGWIFSLVGRFFWVGGVCGAEGCSVFLGRQGGGGVSLFEGGG